MNWPCDDIEPPRRAGFRDNAVFWVVVLIGVVSLALIVIGTVGLVNAEAQTGEPLGTHKKWGTHPALGVVMQYRIDGQDVYYAHPVMANGPVRECLGIMGKHPHCKPFAVRMGAIHLMTIDGDMPYVYMVQTIPTHRRIGTGDYVSLVEATFRRCE